MSTMEMLVAVTLSQGIKYKGLGTLRRTASKASASMYTLNSVAAFVLPTPAREDASLIVLVDRGSAVCPSA